MDTKDLSMFLVNHISDLIQNHPPSEEMTNILAKTYIQLMKHYQVCQSEQEKEELDSHYITALGTVAYFLTKKEISH